jgi:alkylation response protein AidB-like acyl-CoA dehydrogenase
LLIACRVFQAVRDERRQLMPPRGIKKGTKWARMYEHVKKSEKQEGRSEERAEEIAARTVNKERSKAGASGKKN